MQHNFDEIKYKLQDQLQKKRYEHTLGVEETAMLLANIYDEDMNKARLAALLHDCAKNLTDNKKLELCKKYNIMLTRQELDNLDLIHAKIGSIVAREEYEVEDSDVLNAITYHTTGRPNMSTLEKIIYIADYIEPGRDKAPNLEKIRALAKVDLDKALLIILSNTINYLKANSNYIDPLTNKTYEYYNNIL